METKEPKENTVFKARIECSLLRGFATAIRAYNDEAAITIDKDEWKTIVVDPAHVMMLSMKIKTSNFEEYKCNETKKFGLDIDKLLSAIQYTKDRDIVDISLENGTDRITVRSGDFVRRFAGVDTAGMSEPKIPTIKPGTMFSMPWEDFRQIVRRMKSVSDHIKFEAHTGGVCFVSENDTDDLTVQKGKMSLVDYKPGTNVTEHEPAKSLFPLDELLKLFNSSTKSGLKTLFNHERWLNIVTFNMDADYPVKMTSERNGVEINIFLAPRIERE